MMQSWQEPSAIDDRMILMLWKRGDDTIEIAVKLNCKEADVYNRLLHLRECAK